MSAARSLAHLVRADFLERVRRHGFLVTLALAAWLGYTVNAGQFVLRLDHYRGIYNSAWIGGLMASVVTTMLSLFGFYVVKNSVERDRATRVGQILAATPLRRPAYTLAKALSNFLALGLMVAVLALAAVAMQLIHREDARIELGPLLSPFLLIALPAMAMTAALAVLFETVPFLAGSAGNAIYVGVWATSLSAAFFLGWDMLGLRLLWKSMGAACRAAHPDYQDTFDLGFGSLDRGVNLVMLRVGRNICGLRRLEFVATLIHSLLRYSPVLKERFAAVIICSGKIQIALSLDDDGVSFRQCLFRFDHLCLCAAELGFGFRRRDRTNHLSSGDLVALVHGQRCEPARIFRRYIHFRGFDAAVCFHDACGHITAT